MLIPRPNLRLQPDAPNQLSQLGEDQQHNKLPWPTVGLGETLLWGAALGCRWASGYCSGVYALLSAASPQLHNLLSVNQLVITPSDK